MERGKGAIELMVFPESAAVFKQAADALGIDIEIVDVGNTYTKDNIVVQAGHRGVSIYTTRQVNSKKFWKKSKKYGQ